MSNYEKHSVSFDKLHISELQDEITRLRAALERIAAMRDYQLPRPQDIARAALAARAA